MSTTSSTSTIKVPTTIHTSLKILAAQEKVKLQDVVEEAFNDYLNKKSSQSNDEVIELRT